MFAAREPDDVYKALVADLAYSFVPTTIMGFVLIFIGAYVYSLTRSTDLLIATSLGGLASLGKIVLLSHHRRFNAGTFQSMRGTRRLEAAHYALTMCVASSVGTESALIFLTPDASAHLEATALLFAYCSGVVCRLSARPKIAGCAVAIPSLLSVGSIISNGDMGHLTVAAVFLILAAAAWETIQHVYGNARKHITIRLQMEALAREDLLTALPNRLALREAFDALPRVPGDLVAVHAFDLDRFKAVNDSHGHHVGDRLLSLLADRLKSVLTGADIAARIGGDEFVLVQTGVRHIAEVERRAEQVHDVLTRPYMIQGHEMTVGLSLGYSVRPAASAELSALLPLADEASYQAKRGGGGFRPSRGQLQYC